jgi:hypothetical protein
VGLSTSVVGLASTQKELGQPLRAVRLLGAAWGTIAGAGVDLPPVDQELYDSIASSLKEDLRDTYDSEWLKGVENPSVEIEAALNHWG